MVNFSLQLKLKFLNFLFAVLKCTLKVESFVWFSETTAVRLGFEDPQIEAL